MLRQQIRPDQRVHGVITGSEGWVAVSLCEYLFGEVEGGGADCFDFGDCHGGEMVECHS
jgi:hypothetical protein